VCSSDLASLRAVVFDFDGTLAELTIDFQAMRRDVAQVAAGFGLDLEAAGQRYVLEAVAELAASRLKPAQGAQFQAQAEAIIVARELASAAQGRLFPGVREGLTRLAALGLKLAVITRNCRQAVLAVFPDLAEHCHVFLPREDAPRPKPDPAHLGLALDRLAVAPEATLMVGDHPIDVATARAVGAWACGLTTGRMGRADLIGADLILGSLDELVAELARARD
jgi:phosphoglycolate phosphatase